MRKRKEDEGGEDFGNMGVIQQGDRLQQGQGGYYFVDESGETLENFGGRIILGKKKDCMRMGFNFLEGEKSGF